MGQVKLVQNFEFVQRLKSVVTTLFPSVQMWQKDGWGGWEGWEGWEVGGRVVLDGSVVWVERGGVLLEKEDIPNPLLTVN